MAAPGLCFFVSHRPFWRCSQRWLILQAAPATRCAWAVPTRALSLRPRAQACTALAVTSATRRRVRLGRDTPEHWAKPESAWDAGRQNEGMSLKEWYFSSVKRRDVIKWHQYFRPDFNTRERHLREFRRPRRPPRILEIGTYKGGYPAEVGGSCDPSTRQCVSRGASKRHSSAGQV
jgi:hypothetical protein